VRKRNNYYVDAKRLKVLRELHKHSMESMGKLAGVSQQQWSKYESGTDSMSWDRLFDVLAALDVGISNFLAPEEDAGSIFEAARIKLTISEDLEKISEQVKKAQINCSGPGARPQKKQDK